LAVKKKQTFLAWGDFSTGLLASEAAAAFLDASSAFILRSLVRAAVKRRETGKA
jgi:hypothetical protein